MPGASGMGLGLSIPEVAGRGCVPDPATLALVARMTGAPSSARVGAIDACVRALKAGGVWSKLHALWLLAAHDAQAARLDWTGAHDLTEVNAPSFTADRGYAGDGASAHLDTGWAPSMGAQDSICLGVWSRTSAQSNTPAIGTGSAGGFSLGTRNTADFGSARLNSSTAAGATVTDGSGWFAGNRSGANAVQFYRGGIEIGSGTTASTAPASAAVTIGRYNNAYSNRELAAAAIAASLSAGEHAALHAALAGYLAAVGAV